MDGRDLDAMRKAGTSILQKLKDTARTCGMDPEFFIRKFAIERVLVRLNESSHRDRYCIKGGTVMLVANPDMPRATEDLDFTAFEPFDKDSILAVFRDVAAVVPSIEDGMAFSLDESRAAKDGMHREEGGNPGFRLFLDGVLSTLGRPVPLRVKIDAAHGETITPDASWGRLSETLRGWDPPLVPMYPLETVIAEKLHAICKQGRENTRLRDFYDIVAITRRHRLDGALVSRAVAVTFQARGTARLEADPVGLSRDFAALRAADWKAQMSKKAYKVKLGPFEEVVDEVAAFVRPVLAAAADGHPLGGAWEPGAGWAAAPAPGAPPF